MHKNAQRVRGEKSIIFKVVIHLSVLALLLCNSSALAEFEWNQQARAWAHDFAKSSPPAQLETGARATVWAVGQSAYSSIFEPKYPVVELALTTFRSGKLGVKVALQKDMGGILLRRPLVVFLPGVFGGNECFSAYRAIANFRSRGYHVASIPNPWSVPYLKENPLIKPGNSRFESRVVLRAIEKIKEYVGAKYIERIELVGESYGGFLATAALAGDEKSLLAGATVFGPPLHRDTTMQILDEGYERASIPKKIQFRIRTNLAKIECVLAPDSFSFFLQSEECSEHIFYTTFQKNLVKAAEILHLEHGRGPKPDPSSLGFKKFFETYVPESLTPKSQGIHHSLVEWIQFMPEDRRQKLRIMTALDDILNESVPDDFAWYAVAEALEETESGQRLLILPKGGHVGFVGLPKFQDLLDRVFGRTLIPNYDPIAGSPGSLTLPF